MWPLNFTKFFRQSYKMAGFLIYVSVFIGVSWLIIFLPQEEFAQKRRLVKWATLMSRRTLKLFGVRTIITESRGTAAARRFNNHFVVSNHLGYMDVLAISAEMSCCFVTSKEIHDMPGLGLLTEMSGCLYVERRNRDNIHNEIVELTEALKHGLNVCVFPEATSTNGDQVLRFRQPLYNAAIRSDTDVLPVCLNYALIDGQPITDKNRDTIFWYGDMPFLSHLWNLLGCQSIELRFNIDETIAPADLDCPRLLAERSHMVVSRMYERPLVTV